MLTWSSPVTTAAGHRAQAAAVVRALAQAPVEHLQRVGEVAGGGDDGGQRMAGQRGERGGLGALAHDVADDRRPATVEGQQVIEVAPHLDGAARGPVRARHLPPLHRRQRPRDQPGLEGLRDVALGGLELGAVDDDPGLAPEVGGQREVALVKPPRRARDEAEGAEDPVAAADRGDHGRVQADLAQDPQVLRILSAASEHLVGDLVDEERLAGADDRPQLRDSSWSAGQR